MNKRILFVISLCLAFSLLFGQKKVYTLEGDERWESLYLTGISSDKEWIQYYKNTFLGDTGDSYIKEISTDSIFKFPKGYWGKFSEKGRWFTIKIGKDSIVLVDLDNYKSRFYRGIKSIDFTNNEYILLHKNTDTLTFLDYNFQIATETGKISDYAIHPTEDIVAVINNSLGYSSLIIYDIRNQKIKELLLGKYSKISHVSWNSGGEYLIGFGESLDNDEVEIWCYDWQEGHIKILKNQHSVLKRNKESISKGKLSISLSGDRILFHTESIDSVFAEVQEAEEWNTSDLALNLNKYNIQTTKKKVRLNVWKPKNDNIFSLYNSMYPNVVYNENNKFGIIYNPIETDAQFNFYPHVSLFALEIETNSLTKIMDKQYLGIDYLYYSSSGNYLLYFQDNHWWLYIFGENQHYNLTKEIKSDFYDNNLGFILSTPFGFGGWSEDESIIYLYDKYDVWKVNIKSRKSKKITFGAESNTVYRIMSYGLKRKVYDIPNFEPHILDSTNSIIIKSTSHDTMDEYVYVLSENDELKLLVNESKRVYNAYELADGDFLYLQESLTIPTTIQIKNVNNTYSRTIVESNTNWSRYEWPKTKLFFYPNKDAELLRSVLVYPTNYNPSRSYPMIVYIYEKQSNYLHKFSPPSYFNDIGFNILNYSINDYFVLLPDFDYEITHVGVSAVKCAESAINRALTLGNIDKNKIGLIGHSFGGYETAYIITQSSMFRAAVAGAGIFDLTSFSFDIFKMTGQPEIMRTENLPFRMKKSYYETPENYIENSPIHHFSKVNTPLLIWSGKNDMNVNPQQSIEGFLGLYKSRKPATLLLYPNEGHSLLNNKNRKELTIKIMEWFDGYLK